jgi:hypothetical protein
MRAVYAIGALQNSRNHLQAWYESSPIPRSEYSNDGWGIYLPSGTLADTNELLQLMASKFARDHRGALSRLQRCFTLLGQILGSAQSAEKPTIAELPPVATIEPDLAKARKQAEALTRLARRHLVPAVRVAKPEVSHEPPTDFAPARWFSKNTGVPPERLRKAAARTTMRVRTMKSNNRVLYSKTDATRWWPNEMPPKWGEKYLKA